MQSQGELLIDNWLYWNKILHAYAYKIEKQGASMECDFYLPGHDIYIEFWGLLKEPNYDRRREEKLCIYNAGDMRLVQVYPKDLTVLSEILKKKLSIYGVRF